MRPFGHEWSRRCAHTSGLRDSFGPAADVVVADFGQQVGVIGTQVFGDLGHDVVVGRGSGDVSALSLDLSVPGGLLRGFWRLARLSSRQLAADQDPTVRAVRRRARGPAPRTLAARTPGQAAVRLPGAEPRPADPPWRARRCDLVTGPTAGPRRHPRRPAFEGAARPADTRAG